MPDGETPFISWDFGDGEGTAQGASVSYNYGYPAEESITYTVTVTVIVGEQEISDTVQVTVAQAAFPTLSNVGFVANATNLDVVVEDQTSNEVAYTRAWDMGDGTTFGDQATVNHTYATADTYTITLTVTDEYGRVSDFSAEITVEEAEVIEYACEPSLTQVGETLPIDVQFGMASSTNIESFSWDFGGGDVVNSESFTRTYESEVTVSGTVACNPPADSGVDPIISPFEITIQETDDGSLGLLIAAFSFDRSSGPAPFTFTLINESSTEEAEEVLSYAWTVVNRDTGTTVNSTDASPQLTLDEVGIWDITLTVTGTLNGETRTAQAFGAIEVTEELIEPIPDFTITRTQEFGNGQDLVIEIVDNSDLVNGGPIDTWAWTIVDSDGAQLYSFSGPGPHSASFSEEGTYTVTMIVSGYEGRTGGSVIKTVTAIGGGTVTASFDVASITQIDDNGSVAYQVCFTNTSENQEQSFWFFDFVNQPGNSVENNAAEVCTTYTDAGNYQVKLRTVGQGGEASAEYARFVSTATGEEPPVASFTTNRTSFDIGGTLRTTNTSTGNVETWMWEVIDVDAGQTVFTDESNYNLSFQFSDAGRYLVRLTVRNGGGDSQAESLEITVTAPEIECVIQGNTSVYPGQPNVPYNVNINGRSGREVVTQSWNVIGPDGQPFTTGDGSSINVTWDGASGDYTVTYSGELSDGVTCEVSTTVTVEQPALSCVITATNTALIPGEQTTFTISIPNEVQQSWENITYSWNVSGDYQLVGGDLSSDTITIAWPDAGTFAVDGQIDADDSAGAATCIVQYDVIEVGYSGLDCRNPNGDTSPALGETVNFRARADREIRNLDGREYTVNWTLVDRDTNESFTGSGEGFEFTFDNPGASYELTYTVTIDGNEECSRTRRVNVGTERVICQGFGGESSPAYPDRDYTFRYNVDRGSTDIIHIWTLGGVSIGERNNDNNHRVNASAWSGSIPTGRSTVSVQVVDAEDRSVIYCEGTRDITVGQLQVDFEITSTTEVEGGYEVCVNNTSTTARDDLADILDRVAWTWDFDRNNLGASPEGSDAYQPGCFIATEFGEYRIRLSGSVDGAGGGDLAGNRTRSVTFRAEDRINVTASVDAAEGPLTITFTADGENLIEGTYEWSIDGNVFNRSGASQVSRFFDAVTEETQYTITVSAEGETGNRIEANVVVTIFPAGGLLSANFSADRYGVLAGSEVCFTDQSTSNGPALTNWVWNFGDGSPTVSYDAGSYQGTVCHTYTEPGQSYEVSLSVTNEIGLTVSATNTIKTFSDIETSSTFFPVYQGGNVVCFTTQLDEGVVVTGWEYGGAGTVQPPVEGTATCYNYDEAGSYIVSMNIQSGSATGSIPKQVTVGGGSGEQPAFLTAFAQCEQDGSISLIVVNEGGDMEEGETASVSVAPLRGQGSVELVGTTPFSLNRGERATFTVPTPPNNGVVFTVSFGDQTLTVERDGCWDRSSVFVGGECVGNVAIFTVTNGQDSGDMAGPSTWELYEMNGPDQGALLESGDYGPLTAGQFETFEWPQYGGTDLRMVFYQRPGHPGNSTPRAEVRECGGEPDLSVSGVCSADGVATFTITNIGGPAEAFSVRAEAEAGELTVDPETVELADGTLNPTTATVTVTGGLGDVTLFIDEYEQEATTDCGTPNVRPILECVTQMGDGSYIASFGYLNETDEIVEIPVGPFNTFTPGGDLGQPTSFPPGRSAFFPDPAFAVPFDGNNLIWTLAGRTATASANSNPCAYHVLFDKEWVIGETSVDAPQLPEGYSITAASSLGSATCTWANGALECAYNNPSNVVDQRGLAVPTGGTYTVTENNLPEGWAPTAGIGTFAADSGECGVFGLDKFCTHTVINEGAPEYTPNAYCGEANGSHIFELDYDFDWSPTPTYNIVITGTETSLKSGDITDFDATGFIEVISEAPSLTMFVNGTPVQVSSVATENCYAEPPVEVYAQCAEGNGNYVVGIRSVGDVTPIGDASVSYTVSDNNGELVSGDISYGDLPFEYPVFDPDITSLTITITNNTGVTVVGEATATAEECYNQPIVTIGGVCLGNGVFSFSASLTGGQPTQPLTYSVVDQDGAAVQSGSLDELIGGISINGKYDSLTVSIDDNGVDSVTATPYTQADCYIEPVLDVDVYCDETEVNGEYIVSVRNTGGSLLEGETVSLLVTGNTGGEELFNGEITLPFTQSFSQYTDVSATAMISGTDISDSASSDNCYVEPKVTTEGICLDGNGNFQVGISTVGNGTPVLGDGSVSYSITDSTGATIEESSVPYAELPLTRDITDSTADWVQIEITSVAEGSIVSSATRVENCYSAPVVTVTGVCGDANGVFNFGGSLTGDPLGTFTYEATDQDGNPIQSGSIEELIAGISITGDYSSVTVTVAENGVDTTNAVAKTVEDCYGAPELDVSVFCVDSNENGVFGVSVENDGGDLLEGDVVSLIVTANGGAEELFNGTIELPFDATYSQYTDVSAVVSFNGEQADSDDSSDCYSEPQYSGSGICEANGIYVFNVTASGGEPISGELATAVVTATNAETGETAELFNGVYTDLPAQFEGPYSEVVMVLSTTEGTITAQADPLTCYTAPRISVEGVCVTGDGTNGQFRFVASNNGGPFVEGTSAISYEIVDTNGNAVASGSFDGSTNFPVTLDYTGEYEGLVFNFTSGEGAGEAARTPDCFQEPNYMPEVICVEGSNGTFNLSIANTGGQILETLPSYEIVIDGESQGIVSLGTDGLPFSDSLTGQYDNVTLNVYAGETLSASADNSDCYVAPEIVAEVICLSGEGGGNGVFQLNVVNNGGDPLSTVDISVTAESTEQPTIVSDVPDASLPFSQTLTGPYSNVSVSAVSSDGEFVTAEANNDTCYTPPVYEPTGVCDAEENGVFTFVVNNISGEPVMDDASVTYTLEAVGENGTEILASNEPVTLGETIRVEGRYDSVTLTVTTTEGSTTVEAVTLDSCYTSPEYVLDVICAQENGVFTITADNIGGEPVGQGPTLTYDYAIVNGGGVGLGVEENVSFPFELSLTGPYQQVSAAISSPGVDEVTATNEDCYELPRYEPELICLEGSNGTFLYSFTNVGGTPMGDEPVPSWFLRDDSTDQIIASGSNNAPFAGEITGMYESLTFGVQTGELFFAPITSEDPFIGYAQTTNDGCYEPPVYEPSGICLDDNGAFSFSITNLGGTPLSDLPTYTVTDQDGTVIDEGTVNSLPFNETYRGPYASLTLMVTLGDEGELTAEAFTLDNCYEPPAYAADLICYGQDGAFVINIVNTGGTLLPSAELPSYELIANGNVVDSGTVTALPFRSEFVGPFNTATLEVTVPGEAPIVLTDVADGCYGTDVTPEPTPETTPETPPEVICGDITIGDDGFPLIDMNPANCGPDTEQPLVDWEPLVVGEAICPDWLAYHTDITGDWEIFRLGELPDGLEGDLNLTQGVEAIDLAPSRSPDGLWISFTSTRDSEGLRPNWEIYVSRVDDVAGTTRRVSINENAMDLDPVWSPDGMLLAYETTVYAGEGGSWDLMLVDLMTGQKFRLTSNAANDINPFFSEDGSKLLFQSDRYINEAGERVWQIFEMDLSGGFDNPTITRIEGQPDADNYDPQYSRNGEYVGFRSFVDDATGDQSAVYVMNVDGSDVTRVSELGGNALNHAFSPDSNLIAYQSNVVNNIYDIYVYEIETGATRLITRNDGEFEGVFDTAPTWFCESTTLIFTSNVETEATTEATVGATNDNNIYSVEALPIDAPAIAVNEEASQLTVDESNDRDPQNSPAEENASRGEQLPPKLPLDINTSDE